MDEIWKPVVGYEGLYEISNYGKIKSFLKDKNGVLMHFGGAGRDKNHPNVCLSKNKTYSCKYVYILEWEAFIGAIPKGYVVHHKDNHPWNNMLDNLELKTKGKHGADHFSKTVLQIDANTGEIIKEWISIRAARREYGDGINQCLSGRSKTAYGYVLKLKTPILNY